VGALRGEDPILRFVPAP